MRKMFSVALTAALACLVGFAQNAKAGATIDLIWRGDGDSTLVLTSSAASSVVTLDIFLRADEMMSIAAISLQFDADGANELDSVAAISWHGVRTFMGARFDPLYTVSLQTESGTGDPAGLISSYSAAVTNPVKPPPAGTYHIGTAVFHVTANAATDGADIISGLFAGVDFIANATGDVSGGLNIKSQTLFGTATVNIPEPGTAALLGVGLLGLVLAARRRRS